MNKKTGLVAVLGDGAFGTAVATVLAKNNEQVFLWCFNKDVAAEVAAQKQNSRFLPGVSLPKNIVATTDMEQALTAHVVFEAIPVPHIRTTMRICASCLSQKEKSLFVALSKGIEQETLQLSTEIIQDELGHDVVCCALSGPSFARDLAHGQPTVVSLAAPTIDLAQRLALFLENEFFTCVLSTDVCGVQYAGALKNVCALGVGFLAGAGFGSNTQVAFVLSVLEEMKRVVRAGGGSESSLYGPAGIGDLMLTCFSTQSRNYQVGYRIGQHKGLNNGGSLGPVTAEGLNTLASFCALGKKLALDLPIGCALDAAINGKGASGTGLENLLKSLVLKKA